MASIPHPNLRSHHIGRASLVGLLVTNAPRRRRCQLTERIPEEPLPEGNLPGFDQIAYMSTLVRHFRIVTHSRGVGKG